MKDVLLVQYPGLGSGTTFSPPCAKVHMALALKGIPYRVRDCKTPMEAKRFNPRGRVPSLVIDGETIVDSSDILTALDARRPEPPLLPPDPVDRARAHVLEDWADEALYFYGLYLRWCDPEGFARMKGLVLDRLPIPFRWIVPIIARRETKARAGGQGIGLKDVPTVMRELGESLDALDALAGASTFLVGERLTRADIAVAAVVDQYQIDEISPVAAAMVGERPSVVAWLLRVHALVPNAARAVPALR